MSGLVNWVKGAAWNATFATGYALYKTRAGLYLHKNTVKQPLHSVITTHDFYDSTVRVVMVPVSKDNYSYLLVDVPSGRCLAVDPADAPRCLQTCEEMDYTLTGILTTHGHWDHAGGNDELAAALPGLTVYGSADDSVAALTNPVTDGQRIEFENIVISVAHVPCHTRGHLLFIISRKGEESHPALVFTGDTMFLCGCGRFFEGSAAEMVAALNRISVLPPTTRVFCGHEYSIQSLLFALEVDPENKGLQQWIQRCRELREKKLPTVPSTVAEEIKYNPFVRCGRDPTMRSLIAGLLAKRQAEGAAELIGKELGPTATDEVQMLRAIKDAAPPPSPRGGAAAK